ncbi:MAG: hypothetical protein HKN43_06470 [Rhodothermales bacterium]|nr:hypothetical protein [Rhodothermales bacterium]
MKYLVLIIPLLLSLSCRPRPAEPQTAQGLIRATADYLWSQQDIDGGWHSPTHGIASGGESWTPFILYHLLQVPDSIFVQDSAAVQKGLNFIRERISTSGILGTNDPIVSDYPNYASAYAFQLLFEHGDDQDLEMQARITRYLVSQHMTAERGFEPEDDAYGGWGFGETRLPSGTPGHVDLSHTRRVVEALSKAGVDNSVMHSAQVYLRRAQKIDGVTGIQTTGYDGGFFASPVVPGVNKGGRSPATASSEAYYRSYATATSDGILALRATGVSPDDSRILDALKWLSQNPDLRVPAGIPESSPVRWDRVMFYYHLYSRSETYSIYGGPDGWKSEVVGLLRDRQDVDGSFANPEGGPNKEDDPLIASTFALHALLRTLGS